MSYSNKLNINIFLTFLAFGICATFVLIITQYLSNIYVDLSTNASRSYRFLFTMEYFIDQEKYFYLILLHINIAIYIGTIVVAAIGTTLIAYLHHICGMFRIASYRIEHAINFNILQTIMLKNKILMTDGLICAIDIHQQAMKLNKYFMSISKIMMMSLIIFCMVSLSFSLFQIACENDIDKLLTSFAIVSICIICMFLANLMGQKITDHNNQIFTTAYNVQWYETPLYIQKLILFLLQRGTKEFILNVGGLFDASMECFAALIKASISYFTVIYSTR